MSMKEETIQATNRVREAEKAHNIRTFSQGRGAKKKGPNCIQIRVLLWQITLIWIPMHPGVKGGVHFGMGRGAFSERGGAFEMCLFTFVVYILASNRKKHKGKENGADVMFIEAFDWNVGFFKKNGYERVTGMLEDYPRGHVMYCMQKSL